MNKKTDNEELFALIDKAVSGDKQSLETIVLSVQDLIFNLSLRMLGSFADAEDASQDITLKIITHLSSFKKESSFSTWVFRIATNYLINYKKHMFAKYPLSFEYYGEDIENGNVRDIPDLTQEVDKAILAEELKMSCTNVMLQCLDMESRCIFILGTMFRIDSRIAGEILDMTPEAYRQKLSRIRRRVAEFLEQYCGEYGSGTCRCSERLNYAIQNHRLNPQQLDYTSAVETTKETMVNFISTMEDIDQMALKFSFCKSYESPEKTKQFFRDFLDSSLITTVKNS